MLWIVLGLICIAVICVCIISVIENRKLIVTKYQIRSEKIPSCFDGKKIMVLADLHNVSFGNNNEKLIQRIQSEKPDCIILAGDMIVSKENGTYRVPANLIKELSGECNIYYVKGNHELRVAAEPEKYGSFWKDYREEIKDYVRFLDNTYVDLHDILGDNMENSTNSIRLYGLDIAEEYYQRFRREPMEPEYLTEKLGRPEKDNYNILVAHHPLYFESYAGWGADLVISGHLHGGMIRLPWLGGLVSPTVQFFPKYDRGEYQLDNSTLLLSAGLGNHTFKIRVNNLPELMLVELGTVDKK